jgi:hypothetical protein
MPALKREELPRDTELLINLGEPSGFFVPATPVQGRMLRNEIHAAKQPAEFTFEPDFRCLGVHTCRF